MISITGIPTLDFVIFAVAVFGLLQLITWLVKHFRPNKPKTFGGDLSGGLKSNSDNEQGRGGN